MARGNKGKSHQQQAFVKNERQANVADCYLRGMTQAEISIHVGCTQVTVSRDLTEIRNRWLNSTLMDFNEARHQQLARLDQLEREYWVAWERSKTGNKTIEVETFRRAKVIQNNGEQKSPGSTRRLRRYENVNGDPRFLQGVKDCISERNKLLGLITNKVAMVDWREEVKQLGQDPDQLYGELFQQVFNKMEQSEGRVVITDDNA